MDCPLKMHDVVVVVGGCELPVPLFWVCDDETLGADCIFVIFGKEAVPRGDSGTVEDVVLVGIVDRVEHRASTARVFRPTTP